MKSPFLTVPEIAELERIHPKTAYKRALLGKFPGAKKIGRDWRINRVVYAEKRGLTLDQLS